ncbi:glycosyl hydrolase family 8 [Paracoccus ravus]|uniref:glycosyl hydrolase family 8 n=1 Tax=Paracoccus ravus TaxID=2447760 RepID=UPI00106EF067|nr:glycosyl hydrolase family 8 [Paracoccus ravus]
MTHFGSDHPLQGSWRMWKALCLNAEGRVIDGFQNAASHSEGQGYGLALAAMFGDHAAFDAIMAWSDTNLAVRDDALMAWRWLPEADPHIQDRNNATDGDLFFAWGLVLGGERQGRPELIERATRIAGDIVRLCAAPHPDGSAGNVMLPAAAGFLTADQLVVNPSYYMPRAMREVASATGVRALAELADTGETLIEALAQNGLVPDWIALTASGPVPPPENFSRRSGYEAIRVPLMALWSGNAGSASVRNFAQATADGWMTENPPVVFAPDSGEVIERSSHAGYRAVAALSDCAMRDGAGSVMPRFTAEQPYYPATLHLMALVAQVTGFPRCVPL